MSTERLKILEHAPMGRDAWLLRMERPQWNWQAGQLISLCGADPLDQRDYTIASGEQDETLDVIYRHIPHGAVTPHLKAQKCGDIIPVQGPYGRFTLRNPEHPVIFCATGTGISPCRAFMRSYPNLSLTLLHGVRYPEDLYFREEMDAITYLPFCSQEAFQGKTGRLTEALRQLTLPQDAAYYLCGANEMIYEAEEILIERGVNKIDIFHEPYYYRAYDELETTPTNT
ncbi:FAD-binding oxidoreductase [Kiritimatiellota bacterium B12222]|nr:FAD-binding oxidoreductase [Kiritimatiellota bacterium B12222]